MKYEIIGSSSKGNCIVVEDILTLDVGVSYSKIKKYLNKVKLIFVSHIHKDHLLPSTIKHISFNYPNIKYVCGSEEVVKKLVECNVNKKNIFILKEYKWYDLGMLNVMLEPLTHDTPNYGLKWQYKGKKGIYIVDTSNVDDIDAECYDLYLIENNYQEKVLQEHINKAIEENDENKLFYLQRVPHTHLSNEQANSFLIENMGKNSVYEYIHKSNYNYKEE